ncbi:MAG: N-acetylmuramoyl-L-alanine amidase [Lachnospiraceae bacterium]
MRDERFLQRTALYSFAIMMLVVIVVVARENRAERGEAGTGEPSIAVPSVTTAPRPEPSPILAETEKNKTMGRHAELEEVWEVWNLLSAETKEEMSKLLEERCILIKKPAGAISCALEEDMLHHSIRLVLLGTGEETLRPMSVLRVTEGEYIFGEPEITPTPLPTTAPKEEQESNTQESEPGQAGEEQTEVQSNDLLMGLDILSYEEENGQITELSMMLAGYYLAEFQETEEYYVISLKKPKEVYDRIVVIDAGHGGHDPGAGGDNWRVKEAAVNLKLLLYLKEYLDADGTIQAYYTRTENVYPTLPERVELANGVEADLFISFHCNSTVQSKSNGTEIMYNAEQGVGEAFNSKEFAKLCLKALTEALGTKSGGIVKRPDLHIVRRAEMPVVLVETAYLSNPNDLEILKDEEKLKQAAEAMYYTILKAYERIEASE